MTGWETDTKRLVAELKARAVQLGFDAFGIAPVSARPDLPEKLQIALEQGWHGDMDWMAETSARRQSPASLWENARSVIMVGMNYGPENNPLDDLLRTSHGNISVYARNRDYHDIIKGKLKDLAGLLAQRAGAEVKVFVDTAPLMEKPFAEAAGLGWQGKHTVLVSRQHGSWLFLGAILTSAELPLSAPHAEQCGTCRRCLDICPTHAFPAPFQLDARRCIAYLNIEAKGQIPRAYRAPMGNRIYGCDDCLAVCPWNKFASQTHEAKLKAREDLKSPPLLELAALDDKSFRKRFAGSPVKRLGRDRFVRNVLVAIGNCADEALASSAVPCLEDENRLVRGAAIWALRRLKGDDALGPLRTRHLEQEHDAQVAMEWRGKITPAMPEPISNTSALI